MHCAGNRDHHATGEPAPAIPRAAWQAGQLDGDVIRPGDVDYEAARRVWNAAIDREPSLIVRPRGTTDITRTLAFAQANGLPLAIRGGGHSPGGYGTIDNGVVVDMSRMNAVHIDPDRRAARVQVGATWGEFTTASQANGLATPGADVAAEAVATATEFRSA
ncbi:FAD-binding oxidoreductase [Nocardia arizonensis]|uniref:FAD-binding oxidoreductase n=1 Tax=Nocardia arizonensis TaxID=1141647 RepID=UPI0009E8C36C|nr:FAD-binding protein [Nocardia arizonensis]